MKKLYFLIVFVVLSVASLTAQTPEKFSYQAVVRDASGQLLSNTDIQVLVTLLQQSSSGDIVYEELHNVTTNVNGLMTLEIGGGNVLSGSFASIEWSDGPYFLKTEIDPNASGTFTITSVQQLLSVPYALYAKNAENGFSGDLLDYLTPTTIPSLIALLTESGMASTGDIPDYQILSISNDTIFLTNGGFVKLPEGFSGSYDDLTNKPTIPNDNDLVHISGAETISGSKIFTSEMQLYTASGATPALVFQRGNNSSYYDWNIKGDEGSLKINVNANTGSFVNMVDIYTTKTTFAHDVQATSFIKTGGTSSQFLKADGSVDNNSYLTQHQDISGKANTADLATVAFSGSYNDLTNKPTIPAAQVNSDWNATSGLAKILNKPTLATVATSGSYNDLTNKPTLFSGDYNDLTNKPTIPAAQVNSDWNATSGLAKILNKPTLASVATSGSYNDLTNKPTIPAAQVNSDWNATSGLAKILNKPTLATVATSGSYNDLTNKPTIPAAQVNSDWNATSGVAKILNKPTILTAADVQNMINNSIAPLQQKIDSLEGVIAEYHSPISIKTVMDGDHNSTMVISIFSDEVNMSGVTSFGICWSTSPKPTTSNSHVTGVLEQITDLDDDPSTTKRFTCTMSPLTFGTTYYIRAYYVTAEGTFYSPQRPFTPSHYAVPPTGSKTITITGETWIYDYGGLSANYGDNWDGTLVINSGVTGKKVQIDQGTYILETNYDSLSVYCGTQWLASFTGQNGSISSPIQSNNGGTSLTLKFKSDYSNNYIGFAVRAILVDAPCKGVTTVSDYDNNHYPTIEIGNQCWTRQNLKSTHYSNGNSADYYTFDTTSIIGRFYTWTSAMHNSSSSSSNPSGVQGICPTGWHLPSNSEWSTLFNYLKGQSNYWSNNNSTYIAAALAYTSYWTPSTVSYTPGSSTSTNNASGFSAVAAGGSENGDWTNYGTKAYFWSSTQISSTNSYACVINYNSPTVSTSTQTKTKALPVRCVKNN